MSDRPESDAVGWVYGIRLESSTEYRYVGITESTVARRFTRHRANARADRKTPFYDWLRKQASESVVVDALEGIATSRADLGAAEVRWIARLRDEGHRLLNLTDGGLGPTGVVWTDEQREAARIRSTGRPGVSRRGDLNPFFGGRHTEEQRARWSASRRGTNSGADNPNYGRFGAAHPAYGNQWSDEARRRLSEARTGAGNPNFGKSASAETRAKMSDARRGRPMPSSRRSAHTRHHTNTGRRSNTCQYCDTIVEHQFALLLVAQGEENA